MNYGALEELRTFLTEIREKHAAALQYYYIPETGGFRHFLTRRPASGKPFSNASTCTSVLSLIEAGKWSTPHPWAAKTDDLLSTIADLPFEKWTSAALEGGNAFTSAFLLKTLSALMRFSPSTGFTVEQENRFARSARSLDEQLANGYAQVEDYPPSAYLTQLAVRALRSRGALADTRRAAVRGWAWQEVHRQLSLLAAGSRTSDPFQLGYASLLVASLTVEAEATPDENLLLAFAVDRFFSQQLPDGAWPRSQPLFHYPKLGSAYCYEYELLVQLLREPRVTDLLLLHLDALRRAALRLTDTAYTLGPGATGWASGHHPQLQGPESWSTASVFHFSYSLDRLLSEAIRRAVFKHVGTPYSAPLTSTEEPPELAPDLLDCNLHIAGADVSLRQVLQSNFLRPILREATRVRDGKQLSEKTPMSAILFGPPGTSKTNLAHIIADFLGWPLLIVDPSHFVREGLDRVLAEASQLFSMLASSERLVVLLDEFDEMVRERTQAPELLSRFLTTGMLPQLARINKQRRIVFLVATNYVDDFDVAIRRPGRFDMLLQVMPPTSDEKLRRWPLLADKIPEDQFLDRASRLAPLTYGECEQLVAKLEGASTDADAIQLLMDAYNSCTLQSKSTMDEDAETWVEICQQQRSRVRIP